LIVALIPKQIITISVVWSRGGTFKIKKPVFEKLKNLLKPTLSLSISSLLMGLQSQAPIFVCGMVLGPEETGFFSWGWMVAGQMVFLLASNLREVLLPTFTKFGNEPERVEKAALKVACTITAFLCIACGTQALLAEILIKIFLPEKWLPAIPVVVLFSIGLVSQGLWVSGTAWLNASGKYQLLMRLSAFQAVLTAGFTWLGADFANLWGASFGCTLATFGGGVIYIWLLKGRNLNALWKSFGVSFGLTWVLWLFFFLISLKRGMGVQVVSAVLFAIFDGLVWWQADDGGLREVLGKVRKKLFLMENRI
jgi:O-antigen/teichoic acid export membrane protein